MISSIFYDPSLIIAEKSLDGLALRRDLISQNIANVDTPGYKAQEVNFESTLQRAIEESGNLPLDLTHSRHLSGVSSDASDLFQVGNSQGGSTRADGNNVDIDRELAQMTETGIRYQGITTIVNKKFSLLKTIATAR